MVSLLSTSSTSSIRSAAPLLSQRWLLRARVCLGCSNPVGRGGATQLLDPSPQWEQDAEAAVRAAIEGGLDERCGEFEYVGIEQFDEGAEEFKFIIRWQ